LAADLNFKFVKRVIDHVRIQTISGRTGDTAAGSSDLYLGIKNPPPALRGPLRLPRRFGASRQRIDSLEPNFRARSEVVREIADFSEYTRLTLDRLTISRDFVAQVTLPIHCVDLVEIFDPVFGHGLIFPRSIPHYERQSEMI
jgi:hypothetical protein